MERSSSVISQQQRLISKNRKRRTPPNLPCQVQVRTQKWKGRLPITGKAQAMASKVLTIAGNVIPELHVLHSENGGRWLEKRERWRESFLTLCTLFQTMLAPLDTSYTFLTVCSWFKTMSTPLDMSYTFLTVCTWFQTLSGGKSAGDGGKVS